MTSSAPPSDPHGSSPSMSDPHKSFYRSGGTLSADEPSYVVRDADEQLLEGLREGLFCYMLTSRQMGKSSLMNRVANQLLQQGVAVAQIDLTTIGQNLTIEQWYDGLVYEIGRRLKIKQAVNKCWADHAELGPLHRFTAVLREGVLNAIPGNVVIFVDEIDLVRSLPFSTDEFFAAIRECYNRRSSDPEMNRLTFCLLGMATPQDLIRDPRITPFNIGRRIELRDFTLREALQLAEGVQTDGRDGVRLLSRIVYWTNGHPYITQKVCEAVANNTTLRVEGDIDQLCSKLFLSQQARETEANLVPVREYILRSKEERVPALELYQKVRRGAKITFDNTDPIANLLQLSGITRVQSGRLVVRNRIYEQVFDLPWVMSELPEAEVRRQRALVIRGRVQIAAIAIPIVLVFVGLAGEAFRQAQLATASELQTKRALYISDMRLAADSLENNDNASDALYLLNKHKNEDIASFEYPYLWYQFHLADFVCAGHVGTVNGVAFDSTGRSFVTCGNDSTIRYWDTATGKQTGIISPGLNCSAVTISANGRWIAATGQLNPSEDAVKIFDFASQKELKNLRFQNSHVTSISFSADSRYLGVGNSGGATIFDTSTWTNCKSLAVGKQISALKFSPNDPRIVSYAILNGPIAIGNIGTGQRIAVFKTPGSTVLDLAFSKNGRLLAGGAQGGLAAIWNIKTKSRIQTIYNRGQDIYRVQFAPTTPDLITAGADATIKYWNLDTGQLAFAIHGHTGKIQGMDLSPDGRYLATASWDQTAMLWDTDLRTRDSTMLKDAQTPFGQNAVSMDGRLVAGFTRDNRIGVWNASSGERLCNIPSSGPPPILGFVPGRSELIVPDEAGLKIWNTVTGSISRQLTMNVGNIRSFAVSPDGGNIAFLPYGNGSPSVKRLDGSESVEFRVPAEQKAWTSIAFSINGQYLAVGAEDGEVIICDSRNGDVLTRFASGLRGSVSSIAFSPDGRSLALANAYTTIKVWNLGATGNLKRASTSEVLTFTTRRGKLGAIAFADQGKKLIALTDAGTVITWRTSRER